MYVCLCKAVTDKQIRDAVARGCRDLPALRDQLGVTSGCGRCKDFAQTVLHRFTTHADSTAAPLFYSPLPA